MSIIITGTGRYIPEAIINDQNFLEHKFFDAAGKPLDTDNETIIRKFKSITGIEERRYGSADQQTSDIGTIAARIAIEDANIDAESLDGIILAHNFGNIPFGKIQTDILPSLAARVKHNLGIKNPDCIAFDILFGCPGWIQGVIIAAQYIKAGEGKKYLVIGAEMLSRVLDPHDRDSMIYADGAGASIIEYSANEGHGILSTASQSFTLEEAYFLYYGTSLNPDYMVGNRYIKMQGRKIYEFALMNVPLAMKKCLDKSGYAIDDIKKVFIHQANEKMDEAIIKRFFKLCGKADVPDNIMPMSIHLLGNSSVATVPTLFDLVRKGVQSEHQLNKGDIVLLASVGAGMNINAIVYKI
jgi:3-oxoacyl-[acyl-carrier-protein] synthase III